MYRQPVTDREFLERQSTSGGHRFCRRTVPTEVKKGARHKRLTWHGAGTDNRTHAGVQRTVPSTAASDEDDLEVPWRWDEDEPHHIFFSSAIPVLSVSLKGTTEYEEGPISGSCAPHITTRTYQGSREDSKDHGEL